MLHFHAGHPMHAINSDQIQKHTHITGSTKLPLSIFDFRSKLLQQSFLDPPDWRRLSSGLKRQLRKAKIIEHLVKLALNTNELFIYFVNVCCRSYYERFIMHMLHFLT